MYAAASAAACCTGALMFGSALLYPRLLGAAIGFAVVPVGIAAYQTVRPAQLPDATSQVGHAFRVAFWCQAAIAVAALACALWLWLASRARPHRAAEELRGRTSEIGTCRTGR